MKRFVVGSVVVLAALALLFALGPRVSQDYTIRFDDATIGSDPDAFLAAEESHTANLREGLGKEIIWASPSKAKTPIAIVVIHGFSASKGEIRPVPDRVAAALGANLFYTRLTGHGQDGATMATASLDAWMNDVAEALAVGHSIGKKVIVLSVSTGASLMAIAATDPRLKDRFDALVMISPNFGVRDFGAFLPTMPWGEWLANLVVGPEYGFQPVNDLHARFWTWRYPTKALLPMQATVARAAAADIEKTNKPALFIWFEGDKVIDPAKVRSAVERWGGPKQTFVVDKTDDPSGHVLAGDALSPPTTTLVTKRIVTWIRSLPGLN
jgi:pimeloyl-ACP methyl ester carboxylesterase